MMVKGARATKGVKKLYCHSPKNFYDSHRFGWDASAVFKTTTAPRKCESGKFEGYTNSCFRDRTNLKLIFKQAFL